MYNEKWEQFIEGLHLEWPFSYSIEDAKIFAKLSKDFNPIHTDAVFAKSKGFESPLIYGLLLSSQMSRLIGQELPDKNSILTSIKIDFMMPCFANDQLIFGIHISYRLAKPVDRPRNRLVVIDRGVIFQIVGIIFVDEKINVAFFNFLFIWSVHIIDPYAINQRGIHFSNGHQTFLSGCQCGVFRKILNNT